MRVARNAAIVAVIALAIWKLPAGGRAADFASALLALLFAAGLAFFAVRLYLENRVAIYGLGDRQRAVFYGAIGLGFITLVATNRLWASGAGTIAWLALMGIVAYGLVDTYRHWRAY